MALLHWAAAGERAAAICNNWSMDGPGGAVIAFDPSGVRISVAGGLARVGEPAPFDADTVVRWASVTKHVFAAFVLEQGLSLDAKLGDVLPLHPVPGGVTIRQALSMQGGLPDTRELLTLLGLGSETETRAEDLLAWSGALGRLNAEPGTEVAYSNAGYRFVEAVAQSSGMRFADWVAEQGHGMVAPDYWNELVPGLAPGHIRRNGQWVAGGQGMHLSAAGSLVGSATHLASWLADLMTRDVFPLMASPVPLADGSPTGYGLGLRMSRIGGRALPGHGGSQAGYRSGFILDPENGVGVCVVTNRDDAEATGAAEAVMAALLGAHDDARRADGWAPEGLYASENGSLWAELRHASIVVRDAEEKLFVDGDGVMSQAPQSEIRLRRNGPALEGTIGHVPVRLLPARNEPPAGVLDGIWRCDGAVFEIRNDHVHWGAGPRAEVSPLTSLGGGRWLFNALGRRICLRRMDSDRIELSLSRARVVEYLRLSA